jgi:hypothetical protein
LDDDEAAQALEAHGILHFLQQPFHDLPMHRDGETAREARSQIGNIAGQVYPVGHARLQEGQRLPAFAAFVRLLRGDPISEEIPQGRDQIMTEAADFSGIKGLEPLRLQQVRDETLG